MSEQNKDKKWSYKRPKSKQTITAYKLLFLNINIEG